MGCQPVVRNQGDSDSKADRGGASFIGMGNGDLHHHPPQNGPPVYFDHLPQATFSAASKQHLPACLENTRRNVLEQIEKWADSDSDKPIYWLKGMAGTGKSTIALIVARKYAKLQRLGASFFFSRGGPDLASARKFVATIAHQLACISPEIRKHIEDAVVSNSRRGEFGLYDQWEKLVLGPLSKLRENVIALPVIIVVDALDECDEDDITLLIRCLALVKSVKCIHLRVLVTSRPDQPVNLGFDSNLDAHQDFMLDNVENSVIDQDLMLFYENRLTYTATQFGLRNRLVSDKIIRALVKKSGRLFIHAAIICRFIHQGGQRAAERLSLILDAGNGPIKPGRELDKTYTAILASSPATQLEPEKAAKFQAIFRRIVGSMVVLSDAMTLPHLAMTLDMPEDDIVSTLHCLSSVLDIPEDKSRPLRLLHPSFRDFLLDSTRCPDKVFFVDARAMHRELLHCCLRLMKNHLRRNICNLERPGTLIHHVSRDDVDNVVSYPVQYACRYWVHHLMQSGIDPRDYSDVADFFQTRFLFWLEALALMRRLSDGVTMIRLLESRLAASTSASDLTKINAKENSTLISRVVDKLMRKRLDNTSVAAFPAEALHLHQVVYDAMRFFLSNSAIIDEAPLQTYCSALLFSPEESILRKAYSDHIPKWILRWPKTSEQWAPYLRTILNSASVKDVMFSPDGRILASVSRGRAVSLWDAATGRSQRRFLELIMGTSAITFSPDGRHLASASDDQTVRLWDAATGKEQRIFRGHTGEVAAIAFSSDGRLLASASHDKTVRLWDTAVGMERHILRGHGNYVEAIAFSPDGRLLASASLDKTVRLWGTATGREQRILQGAAWGIKAVAFSPDGRLLASTWGDKTVRLWDAATGKERRIFQGHTDGVTGVAFSPDGRLLASVSYDKTVRLWDAATGKEQRIFQGHTGSVMAIAFSPDGRLLASGSDDETVRLWDAATERAQRPFREHVDSFRAIVISPDGRLLASGSNDTTVRLWDAATGRQQRIFRGHTDSVLAVAFSPDGRLLASASLDKTVRLWDSATGMEQRILRGHTSWVRAIAFSPDGRLLASGSVDATARLWDTASGTEQHILRGHWVSVEAIAFSPDGRLLASGSADSKVRLWDTATGSQQCTLRGHRHEIAAIAFSPDGRLLASASLDRTVRLWNAAAGREQHMLRGHGNFVTAIAFSPDGRLLASSSVDGTVRLWDTVAGARSKVYRTGGAPKYLSFSSCGTRLITERGILQVPLAASQPSRQFFTSRAWVQKDGEKLLFIHPEYQNSFVFGSGCTGIIVMNNSEPTILEAD